MLNFNAMIKLRSFTVIGIILLFPLFTNAQSFGGNPATTKWQQLNSSNSRIIFPKELDSQARRIQHIATILDSTTLHTIGSNKRKWTIVLQNQTTVPNAYVRMAPVMSEFYLTPDQDNFSSGSIRWDDNLIVHEDRHIQQFSNFNKGLTKVFSFLLGQEGQLLANGIAIPDYFFEGDAVWQETLVTAQGRGRMPSFFNGMKSLWLQDKKYSWMKLRSGSLKSYLPDHYETGYMLVAYGAEKYGADFWKKVTEDAVRFKGLFYAFNNAIEKYSGEKYTKFCSNALLHFKALTLVDNSQKETPDYMTPVQKNNISSYVSPAFVGKDSLLVTKRSYREVNSFYLLVNGKEIKLRIKDYGLDDYFSYRNGKVVYAAYRSDALRGNRDYSEIRLLDIYTNKQRRITLKTKYFSPDINEAGTEIIAVTVNPNGTNFIHRINAVTGGIILEVPNPTNYFFTQTKYINSDEAVSAARHPDGTMALVKINLNTGLTETLTPFSYQVLGYPIVKNDTVYYSMMSNKTESNKQISADNVFALDLKSGRIYQLTNNVNGIYQPMVNETGDLITSSFTADGYRLQKTNSAKLLWTNTTQLSKQTPDINPMSSKTKNILMLPGISDTTIVVSPYKKSFRLFNFHSARPNISATEYGYTFYGDNTLSSFSNNIHYVYNRNEQSSSIGYNLVYAGAFPFFTAGLEYTYNRNIDTAFNKGINFNAAKANIGFYVPLKFVGGRNFKNLSFGASYYLEQLPYISIGKNVLNNTSFKYSNAFIAFSNSSRQAIQHIHPRWAQSFYFNYRKGFNYYKTGKLTGNTAFYFPGLSVNHSLVINAAFQIRDTLPDFFSNNFSYARGYEALNTRRMMKLGANYHFPLFYPDWGFGNIVYFQRIRANAFFDFNIARARFNGKLDNIKNRSTGAEIYFDTKVWNALPASIGIRYSHLLDTDLQNPKASGRWEIVLPINLIPN